MAWLKLDDRFVSNPKILAAGRDAAWLYLHGLCYCRAHNTEGVIHRKALPGLLAAAGVTKRATSALLREDLWETSPEGLRVHDWEEWQVPLTKEKARKESNAARQRRYRERQGGLRLVSNGDGRNASRNALVTPAEVEVDIEEVVEGSRDARERLEPVDIRAALAAGYTEATGRELHRPNGSTP